jgi:uncharacterized damage-inducible protein DinB
MNAIELAVTNLHASKGMLRRFTDDLAPQEWLHRPCAGGNCAAWIVGHLALTDRMTMKRLGNEYMPPLPDGFEARFARDENAPKAGDYGDVSLIVPTFDAQRDRLIQVVQECSEAKLSQPLEKPHPMFATLGGLVGFMALHTAMHVGQITIIRRSLGKPPIV